MDDTNARMYCNAVLFDFDKLRPEVRLKTVLIVGERFDGPYNEAFRRIASIRKMKCTLPDGWPAEVVESCLRGDSDQQTLKALGAMVGRIRHERDACHLYLGAFKCPQP